MSRSMTCHCQAVMTADDTATLIGPVKAHFDQEHAGFGLTEASVRNYLESEERSTGPTERLSAIGEVEIRPLTPDSTTDVGHFFDIDAFPDNPAWGACYCMFYPRGGRSNESWGEVPWQQNRRDLLARIRDGETTGMLAYVDDKMVGWCNSTARSELAGLATGQDAGVASVLCFAVAPPYRGLGVASRLLEGVVSSFADLGFNRLQGYPVRDPEDERAAFHGSLRLFQKFGFEIDFEEPLVVGLDLG